MSWWSDLWSKREPAPVLESTYKCEVFPHNILDGEYDFEGIWVQFYKPGWNWNITEHREGRWDRPYDVGEGYQTRDAALVVLLERAKRLEGKVVNSAD